MSVFDKHRDTLEHHETMMGSARGRLAVALDLLTDSLALVGQHGVYCRSERFPGKPRMDIALVLEQLDDAKQLVQSAMEELKQKLKRCKADGVEARLLATIRPSSTSSSPGCGRRLSASSAAGACQRDRISSQTAPGTMNIAPSANDERPRRPAGAIELVARSSSSTPTS